MNIPQKAFEAGIEAIVRDGRGYREARKDVQRVLEAAAPHIAAQALRDAANSMKGNLSRVEGDKSATPWLARVNDIGLLLKLAEELDPQ